MAAEYGCARVEDLYADLGYGKWSARQVLSKATGQSPAEKPEQKPQPKLVSTVKRMLGINDSAIVVRGQDDLMVYRAKCCNPIPGDEIVGYVTRGRGVAVHSNGLPECAESAVSGRAADSRRVGQRDRRDILGAPAHSHGGPARDARRYHHGDQRRGLEYPHVSKVAARICTRAWKSRWIFTIASSSSASSQILRRFPVFSVSNACTTSDLVQQLRN